MRARATTAGGSTTTTAWPSSSTSAASAPRPTGRQVVCTHKGLAFNGTFDSAKFSPRDMGIIGAQFPDLTFFTYHSGYDGEHMKAYAGDEQVNSSNRGVDCFIKSLRENGVDATPLRPQGPRARQLAQHVRRDRHHLVGQHERRRPGDAPARQAHHLRRSPPHRVGHATASGTGTRSPRSCCSGRCSSPSRPRSSTTCPTGSTATGGIPARTPSTRPATWWRTRTSPTGRSTPRPTPSGRIRNGILGRNAAECYGLDPDATRHALVV